jgi:hypothetical protein
VLHKKVCLVTFVLQKQPLVCVILPFIFFGILYNYYYYLVQNEIRSLVSLGDGAAGGGSSGSGVALGPRGTLSSLASGNPPPGTGVGGGGGGTGESSSKRSGSGRTPAGGSKKKKENSSGPMLCAVEWWRGEKVEKILHLTISMFENQKA